MQLHDKDRVAYYAALALFAGSLELFIPRILPFFRLGLANIPILLSLDMPLSSFFLLLLLKGVGNSYVSGNLFSVFALISLSQALLSGFAMYGAKRITKGELSNYGLSMIGAIVSTFTQMLLATLYMGKALIALLPLMLTISLFSSLLVGFLSYKLQLPSTVPTQEMQSGDKSSYIEIITLILAGFSVMMIKSPAIALLAFIIALSLQHIAGRKIKLLPHLIVLLCMVFTSLLTPSGRVLYKLGPLSITLTSLNLGLQKAFSLSAAIAISQAYSQIIKPGEGVLGRTLGYFTALVAEFREVKASSLLERAKACLALTTLKQGKTANRKRANSLLLILYSLIFITLMVISRIYS